MEDTPGLKTAIERVVRKLRRDAGLSQQKLADFTALSRTHIAQIEGGKRNATINVLLLIGRETGVSLAEIGSRIESELREINKK